jgi:hypothetical protein
MGEPVGKASGRTFNRMSTNVSDPCWNSLEVSPPIPLKNVKSIAIRGLEERFTHVRSCNDEVNSWL